MANQIQMVLYEGYLADEPEMRFTPAGKAVTNFRIGSHRGYKNTNGEQVKETTWLKVATWGKLAENVNKLCGKGSHVIVRGTLRTNEFGSPSVYKSNDGEYRASFEITANEVRIIKGKPFEGGENGDENYEDTEDVPF